MKNFNRFSFVDDSVELTGKNLDAIVDKFQTENNLYYKRNNITVGVGGKHVIYNLLMSSMSLFL